jgi:putative ATPase
VRFKDGALEHLVKIAAGDARSLLNALELAVETTPEAFPPVEGEVIEITLEAAEESIQKKIVLYDKEGDYHFDTISAFIKSLRGSDPDAALYWLARMVRAGEDPKYIFRRMLILASEDIGMADPQALVVTEAAAAAYERVGLPEGQFHLTQAVLYLASAPKSNSTLGYFDALASLEEEEQEEIPTHLKDTNRDKKGFGHGEGYLYPHAYRDHWVAQQYLPVGLKGKVFYKPSGEGYENEIRSRILRRREAQLESVTDTPPGEILTFSPVSSKKEAWLNRISRGKGAVLEEIRENVFQAASIQRHHRVLVLKPAGGLLLWEALRRAPEGAAWSLVSEKEEEILSNYAETLAELERPVLVRKSLKDAIGDPPESLFGDIRFEAVVGRNILTRSTEKGELITTIFSFMEKGGKLSLSEIVPQKSQRLSGLLPSGSLKSTTIKNFQKAENLVYGDNFNTTVNWDEKDLQQLCREAGFSETSYILKEFTEIRLIREKDLTRWLDPDNGTMNYGRAIAHCFSATEKKNIIKVLYRELAEKEFNWKSCVCFLQSVK